MTDLYQELGLGRDATPADVRRAYHRRALACHPDRGGDPEAFYAVQRAYDVLSDPDRRARYDATGEADDPKPGSPEAEFLSTVHPFLLGLVQEVARSGRSVEQLDVVESLARGLREADRKLQDEAGRLSRVKAALARAADRFVVNDGEVNLLAALARSQLAEVEKNLAAVGADRARLGRALDGLKKYRYKVNERGYFTAYFTAPTSSSNW